MLKRPPAPSGLSFKQKLFVEEYLVDFNATQAAIRAGYSVNGADVTGVRLLGHPRIQPYLAKRQTELQVRKEITVEWVIQQLEEVARVSMSERPRQASAATKALELLGKHLGMFVDKHTLEVKGELTHRLELVKELNTWTLEELLAERQLIQARLALPAPVDAEYKEVA